jgi:hypothetical protein
MPERPAMPAVVGAQQSAHQSCGIILAATEPLFSDEPRGIASYQPLYVRLRQSEACSAPYAGNSNDLIQDYLCIAEDRDCIGQAG